MYTDGSKTEKGAGVGVHSKQLGCDMSIPLRNYATVPQSEILAVCETTREVSNARRKGERVIICTESLSSVKSLGSVKVSSPMVLQCFRMPETLSKDNGVTLTWVPRHSEIPGNERTDELARNSLGLNLLLGGAQA